MSEPVAATASFVAAAIPASASVFSADGGQGSSFGAAQPTSASEFVVVDTAEGTLVTLSGDVLFDFDRSDIRPDARPTLERLAGLIAENAPSSVKVTGHTDAKGADDYNQALSERRAASVRDYLAGNFELEAALFSTAGEGESDPVAPNTTPDGSDDAAGRQRNRRVEFLLAD